MQVGGTTLPTSLARICHNSGRRLAGEAAAVAHAATHGQGEEVVPHPNTCYLVACHLPPRHLPPATCHLPPVTSPLTR